MEIQGIQRITQHKAFEKELSRLGKKYRTIPEDLHTFIDVSVRAVHLLGQKPEDMGHSFYQFGDCPSKIGFSGKPLSNLKLSAIFLRVSASSSITTVDIVVQLTNSLFLLVMNRLEYRLHNSLGLFAQIASSIG